MGHGEQIRVAIESALQSQREQRKPKAEGARKKTVLKSREQPSEETGPRPAAEQSVPLTRLMPTLVERGLELLQDEALLPQVGAILRGLERFDVADSRWDNTVTKLFVTSLNALLEDPDPLDPRSVLLTEAIISGMAEEMKRGLTGENPISLDAQTESLLGQALLVLLEQSAQAVSEQTSLAGSAGCQGWARELSGSVCGFCIEYRDSPIVATLGCSPTLDRLISGLWQVMADFPGAFQETENVRWWRGVLAELTRPRRDESLYDADLVAEAVVLLVERGAVDFTSLVRNPSNKQLFLTSAMRGLLEVFTELIGDEPRFRLLERLGRTELYAVMLAVVCSWIERPEWLFRKPAQQEKAATLLPVLIEALAELDEGSLKTLLRHARLQRVLTSTLLSGLSSKLSSLNGRRIASVLSPVLSEMASWGYAGWHVLLEQDRLTDLLTAVSKSKVEEKLFSEDPEDVRAAARSIAIVAHELRAGRVLALPEMVERMNKGK